MCRIFICVACCRHLLPPWPLLPRALCWACSRGSLPSWPPSSLCSKGAFCLCLPWSWTQVPTRGRTRRGRGCARSLPMMCAGLPTGRYRGVRPVVFLPTWMVKGMGKRRAPCKSASTSMRACAAWPARFCRQHASPPCCGGQAGRCRGRLPSARSGWRPSRLRSFPWPRPAPLSQTPCSRAHSTAVVPSA